MNTEQTAEKSLEPYVVEITNDQQLAGHIEDWARDRRAYIAAMESHVTSCTHAEALGLDIRRAAADAELLELAAERLRAAHAAANP